MLISTQRVVSPQGWQGINVYQYVHGAVQLPANPVDAIAGPFPPRQLRAKWEAIQAGGNLVRSYLDLVAPDADAYALLYQFALECVDELGPPPGFPFAFQNGVCGMRFGISDGGLIPIWRAELKHLFRCALLP